MRKLNRTSKTIDTEPVVVEILPAEPETPSGLTAKEGQTLADISLPENWTWVDSTEKVGSVGTNTFKADYTSPDENHLSMKNVDVAVKVEGSGTSGSGTVVKAVSIKAAKIVLNKASLTYNGKVQKPSVKTIGGKKLKAGTDYTIAVKNSKGKLVASPKAAGKYTVTVTGKGKYSGTSKAATFTILKAANTLKVSGKKVKISKKKVKKKARTLDVTKVIKFTQKGQGEKTYKLVSAKKGKKSFKKKFKINAKTGKVTVKKKTKKGTYKVKVTVMAKGTANYKSKAQTVTIKIKVK